MIYSIIHLLLLYFISIQISYFIEILVFSEFFKTLLILTNMMYHFKIRFILSGILFIFHSSSLWGQCPGNWISNGSFTSVEGENVVAPGWTGGPQGPILFGSPDINDATGPLNTAGGYIWNGIPISSQEGGTWQNLYSIESVEQTVLINQGVIYRLCFEFTTQSISAGSLPSAANIFINNNLQLTSDNDSSFWTWEDLCMWFTAPHDTVIIKIGGSWGNHYLAVDGVCLTMSGTDIGDNLNQQVIGYPFIDGINHTFEIPYILIQGCAIEIYDFTGKLCLQQQLSDNFSFNFSDWKKSIYFYRISKGNSRYYSGKFIKL